MYSWECIEIRRGRWGSIHAYESLEKLHNNCSRFGRSVALSFSVARLSLSLCFRSLVSLLVRCRLSFLADVTCSLTHTRFLSFYTYTVSRHHAWNERRSLPISAVAVSDKITPQTWRIGRRNIFLGSRRYHKCRSPRESKWSWCVCVLVRVRVRLRARVWPSPKKIEKEILMFLCFHVYAPASKCAYFNLSSILCKMCH